VANALHIGRSYGTNHLRIVSKGYGEGTATNVNEAIGLPPTFGLSINKNAALGIANPSQTRSGVGTNQNLAVGQGFTNIGIGLAINRNEAYSDGSLANGNSQNKNEAYGDGSYITRLAPVRWMPGYTSDGTSITIPIAALGENITAAEANAVTGDWREILQAVLVKTNEYHRSLSPTELKQPKAFGSFVFTDYNSQHPIFGSGLKRTIRVKFHLLQNQTDLASEA
jgi:hypothetical protein